MRPMESAADSEDGVMARDDTGPQSDIDRVITSLRRDIELMQNSLEVIETQVRNARKDFFVETEAVTRQANSVREMADALGMAQHELKIRSETLSAHSAQIQKAARAHASILNTLAENKKALYSLELKAAKSA